MNKLNNLRRETYTAASKFLQAQGEFFASLKRTSASNIQETVDNTRAAGLAYKAALEQLIDYLAQPEQLLKYEVELLRTEELADIVQRQLELITRSQSAR